jgi:hypothetical protein
MTASENNWKPITIIRLNGTGKPEAVLALGQIVTERLNRAIRAPYLVYMPEKDRLLMLVSGGYPFRPTLVSSDDHGKTWTEPRHVYEKYEDPQHHVAVGLTYLGKGKLIFCTETNGRFFSEDYGATWSVPTPKPPTSDGKPWNQWDPLWVDKNPGTGNIERVWETGWNFIGEAWLADGTLGKPHAYLRSSTDEGKTWSRSLKVPEWEGACEVALTRAANGDLVAACRIDPPAEYKLAVPEADEYSGLGVSISGDDGKTWSKISSVYAWGRHHPSLVVLPDGRILMTYVVRMGYEETLDGFPQFGIEAVVSCDHGRTWDLEHRYILTKWTGHLKGERRWWPTPQGTSTVRMPDGSILTAYGTCYRCQPDEKDRPIPCDIGLVQWRVLT